jgi:hypothetical protein
MASLSVSGAELSVEKGFSRFDCLLMRVGLGDTRPTDQWSHVLSPCERGGSHTAHLGQPDQGDIGYYLRLQPSRWLKVARRYLRHQE